MEDNRFKPIVPSPSLKGEAPVVTQGSSWIPHIMQKEKPKDKRGRKKVEEKAEKKPVSLSKPIIISLLTLLIMILSLLAPAIIALAKASTFLSSYSEYLLRRLYGDTDESDPEGTKEGG